MNLNYYGAGDVLRLSERRVCDGYRYENDASLCNGAGVVSPANAGTFEEYRYDPLGRRILVRSRVDVSWCNHAACSSTITRFVWDGDQILYEIRSDGNNGAYPSVLENDAATGAHYGRVAYTHGPGIDQPLNLIRIGYTPPYDVIGSAAGFHEWGGPYPIFPHQDWRGSFAGGTTVTGERLPCSTPGSTCTLVQWPAQNFSAYFSPMQSVSRQTWFGSLIQSMADESGLMYRRNRYYDPNTGAFTQEDPIGIAGGLNLYGFGGGDPVTYSDPYGLFPCIITLSGRKRCYTGYWTGRALGVNRTEARWIQRNPRSAWAVNQISTQTLREVANLAFAGEIEGGADGLLNGSADAVRHATWSCRLTQRFDEQTAQEIGDNHEQTGDPASERRMDMRNNAVGRRIASSGGDCLQGAMAALGSGDLYTSPDQ